MRVSRAALAIARGAARQRIIGHYPGVRARLLPWTVPVGLLLAGLAWNAGGMWAYGLVVLFGFGVMILLGRDVERDRDEDTP